jgi:hypothetical protein
MIKSRTMRWAVHSIHVRDDKYITVLIGKPEGKKLDGRILASQALNTS